MISKHRLREIRSPFIHNYKTSEKTFSLCTNFSHQLCRDSRLFMNEPSDMITTSPTTCSNPQFEKSFSLTTDY